MENFLLFFNAVSQEYFSQKNRIGLVQITTEKQNASRWAGRCSGACILLDDAGQRIPMVTPDQRFQQHRHTL
ncbi:hypothetical protein [Janthinobacterium sp. K2E3]|uniref:hypothetical protein n=1 Tax=Janthinobacterium sp. K2E3 TaxID=2723082 RepID=UPI00161676CA|nr:hypothetical protein [Janthinobacterium sp. K2E3]MBB5388926.1 hypothetical protein [Janthinobacterium sp. K2E3]